MEKIEEFLEDMRMEGKAEGTLREYKRRLERVQKLGIDLEKCTKTEFLSSFLDTKLVKLSKTSTIRCILSTTQNGHIAKAIYLRCRLSLQTTLKIPRQKELSDSMMRS